MSNSEKTTLHPIVLITRTDHRDASESRIALANNWQEVYRMSPTDAANYLHQTFAPSWTYDNPEHALAALVELRAERSDETVVFAPSQVINLQAGVGRLSEEVLKVGPRLSFEKLVAMTSKKAA